MYSDRMYYRTPYTTNVVINNENNSFFAIAPFAGVVFRNTVYFTFSPKRNRRGLWSWPELGLTIMMKALVRISYNILSSEVVTLQVCPYVNTNKMLISLYVKCCESPLNSHITTIGKACRNVLACIRQLEILHSWCFFTTSLADFFHGFGSRSERPPWHGWEWGLPSPLVAH